MEEFLLFLSYTCNIFKAEKWLHEQAQTLGWHKATKLEGRQTSQGLIGVIIKNECAGMIELNCETDFVARNKEFRSMVEAAAESCINYASKQYKSHMPVTKVSQFLLKFPVLHYRWFGEI